MGQAGERFRCERTSTSIALSEMLMLLMRAVASERSVAPDKGRGRRITGAIMLLHWAQRSASKESSRRQMDPS